MLNVRLATLEDVHSLAHRLRESDLIEIKAGGRDSPLESLLIGLNSPDPTFVAVDSNDVPHVIFGTHPSDEEFLGYVWMMASDGIKDHWIQLLRETKPWVDRLKGHYKVLANAVHKENKLHIKWLQWAGFTFLSEFTTPKGDTFIEFAKMTRLEDR